MSALTSALQSPLWLTPPATPARPAAAVRVTRFTALCCLLCLVFVTEYEQTSSTAAKSILYDTLAGGFRVIDLLVLCLALLHGFALGCSRKRIRLFPRKLKILVAAFGMAIAISLVYGMERGGRNLFFDWRALALGLAFYLIYRFWIQSASDARAAIIAFGLVIGMHIVTLFLSYLRGQGDSLLGMRIPLFDGPSISAFVFAALLGLSLFGSESSTRQRWLWLTLSAAAMLLVALCFRRTYWAELAIGVALLVMNAPGRRLRTLALPLCMTAGRIPGPRRNLHRTPLQPQLHPR